MKSFINYVLISLVITVFLSGCNSGSSSSTSNNLQPSLSWTKQVGGTIGKNTFSSATNNDSNGNTYITGYTNVGISGQTQNGKIDYFIAKYSESGTLIWTRQVGESGGFTLAEGVSNDLNGNTYITGFTTVGISGESQIGNNDYFIAKYSESGTLIWTRQVGVSNGNIYSQGISTDSNGNSYITGVTDMGISGQTKIGNYDYFIAKYSESGTLIWTRQVGANNGYTFGAGISTDSNGNPYITGSTNVGISGQMQNGDYDYFIAKYDANGSLNWTRQVGSGNGNTYGAGISTDSNGNAYITGYTDVGISGQTQVGQDDYFIAKYSESGSLTWTKQVGASNGYTFSNSIRTDLSGNSYVTGSTNVGISGQTKVGQYDYFIAKYSESGNLIWTGQVGESGGYTSANGVSTDSAGNPNIVGYTDVGISGESLTGQSDYFIAKYNASGSLNWTRQVGGAIGGNTFSSAITTDSTGKNYITGSTNAAISGQTQNGDYDYFIAKYSESGGLIWSRQIGINGGSTYSNGISIDSSNNSYITGYTNVGISGQTQVGQYDYFIAKYSESGNLIWTHQVGESGGITSGYSISTDSNANIYITGYTDVGISGESQNGNTDYFVAKYSESGILIWTHQVGESGGNTYSYAITTDSSSNAYITGSTDVGISGQSQVGDYDYFIAKYSESGGLIWSRQVGESGGDTYSEAIHSDLNGNTYITGSTNVGISGQTQIGNYDYFIAKYSKSGTLTWATQLGVAGGDTYGSAISTDSNNNIYIDGSTNLGVSGQKQIGQSDYFIAKYVE